MVNQSRRNFLRTAALACSAVTGLSSKTKAAPKNILSEDRNVLTKIRRFDDKKLTVVYKYPNLDPEKFPINMFNISLKNE
jgi:hypothetical protein